MRLFYLRVNKKKILILFLFSIIFFNNYFYKKEYLPKIENNFIEHSNLENNSHIFNKKLNDSYSPVYALSRIFKLDLGYFINDLDNKFILLQKNNTNIKIKNNFIQLLSNYHNKVENLHLIYTNDNGDQISTDINGENIIQTNYANYFNINKFPSCEFDCFITDLYILYKSNFHEQNLVIKKSFFDIKDTENTRGSKINKNFYYYNYEDNKIFNYKLDKNLIIFFDISNFFKNKHVKVNIDTFIAIFLNFFIFIIPLSFLLGFFKLENTSKILSYLRYIRSRRYTLPHISFRKLKLPHISFRKYRMPHISFRKYKIIILTTLSFFLCYINSILSIYILLILIILFKSIIHAKKN